ncbi:hypothetical protein L484_021056 [Morus notabilis]|uniref:Uncharacterized protein n=1 Tax=Morus notabilis TaxID=981085 RepID=W9R198_9ROSA|nr:hypothetical protein L484_021056 [Morus notabilis]
MSSNNNNNNLDNLSNQQKFKRPKLRVSINLPDNEISLLRNRQLSFSEDGKVTKDSIMRLLYRLSKKTILCSVEFWALLKACHCCCWWKARHELCPL